MEHSKTNPLYASISRRRALTVAGSGAAGLFAAALIGCTSSTKQQAAPAANQPAAGPSASVPSKPKPGGILRYAVQNDPDTLDPVIADRNNVPFSSVASKLFTFEPGQGSPATGKIVGDHAEKWEQPDPNTLIIHLNPAAKFDDKAPLNGRAVTSDDVLQSWKKFSTVASSRTNFVNSLNPLAPITSLEAVDPLTIRIKTAFPDSTLLSLLTGSPVIQPAEGIAGKIDLTKDLRGAGPFVFESYKSGVSMSFKRNPHWHGGNGRPYVDGIEIPIIADQAQTEVQFRNKKLHWAAVSRDNIAQFAKELPGTEIGVGGPSTAGPGFGLSYAPGQPWHDIRVRRAVSMSMNRDTWADVLFNTKQFAAAGVKLTVRWNGPIGGGFGAYWLNPKDSKFGPAAQWLQHNVAESKKLLDAAGFNAQKPLEFDIATPGVRYGRDYPTRIETWQAMMRDAGIKANILTLDYATEYNPKYIRVKPPAQFEGRNVKAANQYFPFQPGADAVSWYINWLSGSGAISMTGGKFPELDDKIFKARAVTNFEERVAAVHELNRWSVDNMVTIAAGPDIELVDLIWKGLRGPQLFTSWAPSSSDGLAISSNTHMYPNFWFDDQI